MISTRLLARNIRKRVLTAIYKSKASHLASALSICDLLAVLYGNKFVDPTKKQFILSKGHAGIAVYSTLNAINILDDDIFSTYYQNGSKLGGHVSHKSVPGVCLSTGSLGGGIAVANGILTANLIDVIDETVYVIVGDGECNEGSIWESIIYAGAKCLNNLVVIIDRNYLQGCGSTEKILSLGNMGDKIMSFGWDACNIDGHNHNQIFEALKRQHDLPLCIVANTVKGKGVSFMENDNLWHYKNVNDDTFPKALAELGEDI